MVPCHVLLNQTNHHEHMMAASFRAVIGWTRMTWSIIFFGFRTRFLIRSLYHCYYSTIIRSIIQSEAIIRLIIEVRHAQHMLFLHFQAGI